MVSLKQRKMLGTAVSIAPMIMIVAASTVRGDERHVLSYKHFECHFYKSYSEIVRNEVDHFEHGLRFGREFWADIKDLEDAQQLPNTDDALLPSDIGDGGIEFMTGVTFWKSFAAAKIEVEGRLPKPNVNDGPKLPRSNKTARRRIAASLYKEKNCEWIHK